MFDKLNQALLTKMHAAMTEASLNDTIDQTMRLMTYYARGLDSKVCVYVEVACSAWKLAHAIDTRANEVFGPLSPPSFSSLPIAKGR